MSENTGDKTNNALVVINNEHTSTTIGITTTHDLKDADNTPRILCNELLVKPQNSASLEKLDELSSLEREIAKMHHVEDETNIDDTVLMSTTSIKVENSDDQVQVTTAGNTNFSNGAKDKHSDDSLKTFEEKLEDKLDAMTSGETALEHEDLIAVLKGLDGAATKDEEDPRTNSDDPVLEEGVTIEGEGEYQIMEVIDDDSNAAEEVKKVEAVDQLLNKNKRFGSTTLTQQEERALALEQIEVLKTAKIRRRKQDIKPIKQIDNTLDLVSALEAEWSENDDDTNTSVKPSISEDKNKSSLTASSLPIKASTSVTAAGDNKTKSAIITSVVVIPTQVQTKAATSTNTTTPALTTTNIIKSISASEDKMSTKSSSTPVDGIIDTKQPEQNLASQTGFRRTRIIKRKIIWDPDAPETTFSYAKLVKPNSNNTNKTKNEAIPTTTITKGSTTITPIKKEIPTTATTAATTPTPTTKVIAKKIQRPITPKDKKLTTELNIETKISTKPNVGGLTKTNVEAEASNSATKKSEEPVTKTTKNVSNTAEVKTSTSPAPAAPVASAPVAAATKAPANSPAKRRSQTPVGNGPGGGAGVKKKKITEVDRLMGDEGAVNMLNSLEKIEATLEGTETKPTRPMMRSRASTICEKFPRKESTSPAKTTSPTNAATSPTTTPTTTTNQQTNKGKRTNKPRASSSWDYVYKQKEKDFDDSLIIRRRSNSSYSSTTSLNRLSLDGPPSSITNSNSNSTAASSKDTKSSPASKTPTTSSKTSPSSANNKSAGSSKNSTPTSGGKSFEFAKPENKKAQRRTKSPAATLTNDMKKSAPAAGKRNTRSPATISGDDAKDVKPSSKSPTSPSSLKERKESTPSPGTISDVVVKKSSKVAQIIFSTNKAKLTNTFTIQMLNKLVDILGKLASDPDCHIIVMATNDTHFCQGVDITELTRTSTEKRKNYSTHLAMAVKNYLKTLANYPKPLIAGINGNVMNLGVMQLALFDIVIAGDKTTFETPYVKMGQVPEGYSIWNNMNKIRGSFKTKIFWLCERIQSTEAALAGVVNKLTAPNKVNEEALSTAKRIASYSTDSYRGMKKTVIHSHSNIIDSSLDEEFDTIIKQWSSSECLENMKKIVEQGHY